MGDSGRDTQYWLLALPLEGGRNRPKDGSDHVLATLKDKAGDLATTHKFTLPELRVGTLDSLLALSDDLVKTTTLVEAVVAKVRRQLVELEGTSEEAEHADSASALLLHALGFQATGFSVDGVPVKRFISGFVWNEAKHPARRPLRETAEKLAEGVARLEEELKVKTAEYNALKSQLGALTRKAGGSLATRDLGDISAFAAQKQLLVESEHMTTLFGVVPAHSAPEWRASYEKLAKFVVPRSSKLLKEESDYCLFTVVVFKKCAEEFKHACREKGYQIREVSHDAAASHASAAEVQRISGDMAARKASLLEWCRTAFGEAFAALLHVAAVRLFVESILRYGLPPCFATALCCVDKKHEKRLRGVLTSTFGRNASIHWKQREEDAAKGEDVHPYVSLTLALPQ